MALTTIIFTHFSLKQGSLVRWTGKSTHMFPVMAVHIVHMTSTANIHIITFCTLVPFRSSTIIHHPSITPYDPVLLIFFPSFKTYINKINYLVDSTISCRTFADICGDLRINDKNVLWIAVFWYQNQISAQYKHDIC